MQSILVTGGSGTFGRAFIRACLSDPRWRRVIAFSRDEVKHAQLWDEFGHHPCFRRPFGGDVRDIARVTQALRDVDVVVHAAALKRVDQGAYNPTEMVETNIKGTINVVNASIACGVHRVVVLSSDKACAPTNLYGMTKGCAETCAIQANSQSHPAGTRVSAVRYGNILASRGSVVHIWRDQMRAGLPLTITDPRMTRFIMTIEQAVELVLFALDTMAGGEVFIPSLPSAYMSTLADAIAGPDYARVTTGLRPGGEKMAERLLNEEEPLRTRRVGQRYFAVLPTHHEWTDGSMWRYGEAVDPAFEYRSDINDSWLSAEQLRDLLNHTVAA